ncbi:uncharacterized protein BDCG_06307 [Blastomyces dermatitidis ER-3]|uniref:HNH nuclease domain-containing protein n=1 Tax=Ajellomyces dermatitidis (strain ER-3 / ATCC MYA-2586) TaxID=559297 RepID=A0ABP2F2W4_AJEDR|nr:uncharacterized protein BDCG_06307 [Blastomyces dermatitidis ER-3]EEQ91187.2 hypothetical protein BDCG_06307 [Blastomyces dermatitidis ER-3]
MPHHLVFLFCHVVRASSVKTPQPKPTSLSSKQAAPIGTRNRVSKLRQECLSPDHHRCVASRKFDRAEVKKRLDTNGDSTDDDRKPLRDLNNDEFECLEVAHIIPHSLTFISPEDLQPLLPSGGLLALRTLVVGDTNGRNMKFVTVALVAISLLSTPASFVLGQDPGPSPTESVGCTPHGDHWHCAGPRLPTGATKDTATRTAADPGPSPTESVGCKPHGDHWHCAGPRLSTNAVTTGSAAPTTADPGRATATATATATAAGTGEAGGIGGETPVPTAGGAVANFFKLNQCVGVVGVVIIVMMM